MEGKMKAAVMLGIGKMGFEERDIPKAKDNEVLVKLEYVGICGSDLQSRPLYLAMSRAEQLWKWGRM